MLRALVTAVAGGIRRLRGVLSRPAPGDDFGRGDPDQGEIIEVRRGHMLFRFRGRVVHVGGEMLVADQPGSPNYVVKRSWLRWELPSVNQVIPEAEKDQILQSLRDVGREKGLIFEIEE
jgi:hypothetical protein